jgi:protein SCO1/2
VTWHARLPVAMLAILSMAALAIAWSARRPVPAPQPAPAFVIAPLGFSLPRAGSYRLERILRAPDGPVLDTDGRTRWLRDFTTGRITLFSFIYTYCTDARGCPLAYATLHTLKASIAGDATLRGKVRFVSMSFDPAFDTPAMMRNYGGSDARSSGPVPWHFLTTASAEQLSPLLSGFGQDVAVIAPGQSGHRVPVLNHLLKVYLIDRTGTVREIYSTAYLHPAVLRNDVATLLAEQPRAVH